MKSSVKITVVLVLFSAGVILGAEWLWEREGFVWSALAMIMLNGTLFFYSDRHLLKRLRCRPVVGQDPWGLGPIVPPMARQLGFATPKLYVFPESAPTALSIGTRRSKAALIFSEGLLNQFSKGELKAVIAHELTKIQRGETPALTMSSAIASGILFLPSKFDQLLTKILGRQPESLFLLTRIVAPIAGLIVSLTISRKIYLESDRRAAEVVGDSMALAKVLWKMTSYSQTTPIHLPATTSHLFTVNPLTSRGWTRYFHCQPPIEQRIRGLVGYFPI